MEGPDGDFVPFLDTMRQRVTLLSFYCHSIVVYNLQKGDVARNCSLASTSLQNRKQFLVRQYFTLLVGPLIVLPLQREVLLAPIRVASTQVLATIKPELRPRVIATYLHLVGTEWHNPRAHLRSQCCCSR